MLAKNISNEVLYLSGLVDFKLDTPVDNIFDYFSISGFSVFNCINDLFIVNSVVLDNYTISPSLVSSYSLSQRSKDIYLRDTDKYSVFKDLKYPYIFRKRFKAASKEDALIFYKSLLNLGEVTLSSSNALSINAVHGMNNVDAFYEVWDRITHKNRTVTIENTQKGDYFKIIIKGSKILGVLVLVPAFVVGDGKSTIGSLISQLEHDRRKNILYKNYPLKRISKEIDRDYIPLANEVVKLKESRQIEYGAVYLDLTEKLRSKFQQLVLDLKSLLLTIPYLEIGCYSEDIESGLHSNSFVISDFKQDSSDIRHLLSVLSDKKNFENTLNDLFLKLNNKQGALCLDKAITYSNTHLKSTDMTYLLKEAAYYRGLSVEHLERRVIKIENPINGEKALFRMGMSQYTTSVARRITKDKYLTKRILEKNNINTPMGFMFDINEVSEAWKVVYERCVKNNKRLVLKPLDRNAGTGVSTDITTEKEFINAWGICEKLGSKKIVVEEQFKGDDYRLFVVQNKVCAATQRISAFVLGDGIHTVEELIKLKNEERKKNLFLSNLPIKITDRVINFLSKRGLDIKYIALENERIQLSEVANASVGGDTKDRTDDIHPDWIPIAIKARRVMADAFHVGLDIMMEDISISPFNQKWAIIEINTNPDYGMQLFPGEGQSRNTALSLLDALFLPCDVKNLTYKLVIIGKIQGVGYRKWFKSICDYRSITGYIKNLNENNKVEAVIVGPEEILNEIVKLAYVGSKSAVVDSIIMKKIETLDYIEWDKQAFSIQ